MEWQIGVSSGFFYAFFSPLGSHGASSAHETITPLIAWGKRIATAGSPFKHSDLSPFTESLARIDIHQADLCPLIACLLGVPIPAHSIVSFSIYRRVTSSGWIAARTYWPWSISQGRPNKGERSSCTQATARISRFLLVTFI